MAFKQQNTMKKAIFMTALLAVSFVSFGQSKKTDPVKKTESSAMNKTDSVDHFILDMSIGELVQLNQFIISADLYSDKGREQYAKSLLEKVKQIRLPVPADTTKKK